MYMMLYYDTLYHIIASCISLSLYIYIYIHTYIRIQASSGGPRRRGPREAQSGDARDAGEREEGEHAPALGPVCVRGNHLSNSTCTTHVLLKSGE